MKEIGERIQQARKQKNMTQADLADRLGIALSHMSNIECGKSNFSVEILLGILESLDISADWLLMPENKSGSIQAAQELEAILSDCTGKERAMILEITRRLVQYLHLLHE